MSTLAVELLHHVFAVTFAYYTVIVVTHFTAQTFFAHRLHRESVCTRNTTATSWPTVDIVVAAYNESAPDLRACFDSLVAQDYQGEIKVFAVDDCSSNRTDLMPIYGAYGALPGWTVLLPKSNRGKRHAQDQAVKASTGQIVVTIDSDTIVAPDGVREIVQPFRDLRVGAVTGDVGVTNSRTNLLTRLIGMRYWIAFNQERAAQSWVQNGPVLFGASCCVPPIRSWRRLG